jgi:ankyrin repeat protein
VHMSVKMSDETISRLQKKYYYLTNFSSSDPNEPIDPIGYRDAGGDNLMMIASRLGDLDTISILLNAGVDINEQGEMGCTALHYAYERNRKDVVDFLLANGASREIEDYLGRRPG